MSLKLLLTASQIESFVPLITKRYHPITLGETNQLFDIYYLYKILKTNGKKLENYLLFDCIFELQMNQSSFKNACKKMEHLENLYASNHCYFKTSKQILKLNFDELIFPDNETHDCGYYDDNYNNHYDGRYILLDRVRLCRYRKMMITGCPKKCVFLSKGF